MIKPSFIRGKVIVQYGSTEHEFDGYIQIENNAWNNSFNIKVDCVSATTTIPEMEFSPETYWYKELMRFYNEDPWHPSYQHESWEKQMEHSDEPGFVHPYWRRFNP